VNAFNCISGSATTYQTVSSAFTTLSVMWMHGDLGVSELAWRTMGSGYQNWRTYCCQPQQRVEKCCKKNSTNNVVLTLLSIWLRFYYIRQYQHTLTKPVKLCCGWRQQVYQFERDMAQLDGFNKKNEKILFSFNGLLTVHHAMILCNCPTWRTISFQCIYLYSSTCCEHVMLIIRRNKFYQYSFW